MCGRGGLTYTWKTIWEYLNLIGQPPDGGPEIRNLSPSYRRADEVVWSHVPAVRSDEGGRTLYNLVWPLVPFWLKGELPKFSTANCRSEPDTPFSETVAGKPAFRNAWKRNQRCLVPMSYFYEWDQRTTPKQPWRIYPTGAPVLVLAGLWERSPRPDGEMLESFAIVTTEPNRLLTDIGHHRAPVVLEPDDWDDWLNGEPEAAEALIRAPGDAGLAAHRVTRRVNNPGYQEADLLQEIAD